MAVNYSWQHLQYFCSFQKSQVIIEPYSIEYGMEMKSEVLHLQNFPSQSGCGISSRSHQEKKKDGK